MVFLPASPVFLSDFLGATSVVPFVAPFGSFSVASFQGHQEHGYT